MSNWAENPSHSRDSLMGYSLPNLLFTECHRYCVDNDMTKPTTDAQITCITNCQEKTYKAFDLYM
jgi:hypothetical protein